MEGHPDDPSISDATELYRRIHPRHHITWDDNRGAWRVKSAAFQNTTGTKSMSVALGDVLQAAGRSPTTVLALYPDWYLASLTARFVRQHDQGLLREPTDEEPAHGAVVGEKRESVKRAFAREARWVVAPEEGRD